MRGTNLVKLFRALECFAKPAGTTVRELQNALSLDRRSVYRLIGTMEELGFPIWAERENG